MQKARTIPLAIICCFLSVVAYGQQTIDATVPIRNLRWETQGGSGGGIGARIPVSVTLERTGDTDPASGAVKVAFVVTNSGKDDFQVAISPQPADLEPDDPHVEYTVTDLALSISEAAPPFKSVAMVMLCGKPDAPGTMLNLHPGQSIRALAIVRFPSWEPGEKPIKFKAMVSKGYDIFRNRGRRRTLESHDIGFALSDEFTLSSLPSVSTPDALHQ